MPNDANSHGRSGKRATCARSLRSPLGVRRPARRRRGATRPRRREADGGRVERDPGVCAGAGVGEHRPDRARRALVRAARGLTVLAALAWARAAAAGCPPPRHPPPVTQVTRPRWLPGVLITEYYPAPERWFGGRLVRAPGLRGRHRAGWLYSARGLAMQGEGVGSDGRMYHFA